MCLIIIKIIAMNENKLSLNDFIKFETISCLNLKKYNQHSIGLNNTLSVIQHFIKKKKIDSKDCYFYFLENYAGFVYGYKLNHNGFKISLIAIDPKYQNKKLGSLLIQYLQNNYSYLISDIQTENYKSKNLFKKFHFNLELKPLGTSFKGVWKKN